MKWSILYRGPLSSCNYACGYCPFAKRANTRTELADDEAKLARFTEWVRRRPEQIGILFTPWGEALHHRYYQRSILQLSQLENVWKVAIQTNLSAELDWIASGRVDSIGIWATWHPEQVSMSRFLAQCAKLKSYGIRFSVGIVGTRDHLAPISAMRAALDPAIYLWVNAYKDVASYYSADEIDYLARIDPHFGVNLVDHPSLGAACRAGSTVFSVDGDGDMRRCHFIKDIIGNIYADNFCEALQERPCVNRTCGCHIGYVHMDRLKLGKVYGDGILERIPSH